MILNALAAEAGLISSEYNGFDRTKLTAAQRKFAELIIKECCHAIDPEPLLDIGLTEESIRYRCILEIMEHMGMK